MNTHPLRRHTAGLAIGAFALLALGASAHAQPVTDQNAGTWVDNYDDSSGIAPAAAVIGGLAGQAGIVRDPIARSVSPTGGPPNYFFTSEILPASFDAWTSLYIDYTASATGQVQVEVWDATNPASVFKVLGPVNPGISDDPSHYSGQISLAGVSPNAKRLRVRVLLADGGTHPSVSALKVTFHPQSVLDVTLEVPTPRPTGDVIQVRMPVSVSYVHATGYVAYLTHTGVRNDSLYHQNPILAYESSTLGGHWTSSAITVRGVPVPKNSVYWDLSLQEAGKTYAYYATFRSPNGLARELGFDFRGEVHAANAATVTTPTLTSYMESFPRTNLTKTAGGTFVVGGEHFAEPGTTITLDLAPTNWYGQSIPFGAQSYFQPVVWESFQDFLDKGVADYAGITPLNGGTKTLFNQGAIVRGIAIPPNSVYWDNLADMGLGARLDLAFTVAIKPAATRGTIVDDCTSKEAWLATPQESIPDASTHDCGFDTALNEDACTRRSACLPIHIGVDATPGFAFAKGDTLGGSTVIQGNYDDHPLSYVTWGDPIRFDMAVGNSALARLDHVVVYDFVKYGWTLVSASVPAPATVYYWWGGVSGCGGSGDPDCTLPPAFYTNASFARDANWHTTPPPTPTWVAYEIPSLRSTYCTNPPTTIIDNCTGTEPTGVSMSLSIVPSGDDCDTVDVFNQGYVHVYADADLDGNVTNRWNAPLTGTDQEQVQVRPLRPNLATSYGTGAGSVTPGNTATHQIVVQNFSNDGPIDTATNVTATVTIPSIIVNGLSQRLTVVDYNADGGSVSGLGTGTMTVTWPSIPPTERKTFSLTYDVPVGIRSGKTFTTVADITANPDCGDVTAQAQYQTTIASSPSLKVDKDLNYRVVSQGTFVEYTIRAVNDGTAPSTRTWVLDHIDPATELYSVTPPPGGKVVFSNHVPPFDANAPTSGGLPTSLLPSFRFSDAVVAAHFVSGIDNGDGTFSPPPPSIPPAPPSLPYRWVAILFDAPVPGTPAGEPDIFLAGVPKSATITIRVSPSAPTGQLVTNEPGIVSAELLQAVGNRVEFLVSTDPGVRVVKMCPDVVSNLEPVDYYIELQNDTTNLDATVVVKDTLPAKFKVDQLDAFDPEPDSLTPEMVGGRAVYTWTFANITELQSTSIRVSGYFDGALSNTFQRNEVLVTATNDVPEPVTLSFFDDCPTLIQNTDLEMVKLVDNPEPRSGDQVTYVLQVINHMQRAAEDANITDVLDANSTFVGDLHVLTPGWSIVSGTPSPGAHAFTLVLQKDGYPPGVIPTGTVALGFKAEIGEVDPGTKLTNTATATTGTGQECVPANEPTPCKGKPDTDTVDVITPLPDVYVKVTSPPLVEPGATTAWTLTYGNLRPEDSANTVVFFSLPDGPPDPDTGDPNATPNQTDFTLGAISAPSSAIIFYSTNALDDRPAFDPSVPGGTGWTTTKPDPAVATVNHLAFFVKHCDATPCDQGDIDQLQGPFQIVVQAEARRPPVTDPVGHAFELPAIGGSFEGCADIAMIDTDFGEALCLPDRLAPCDNNHACATVKTPGVGLKVVAECTPDGAYPGILPGDIMTFAYRFTNTGTVPDYNVWFSVELDADWLEYLFDDVDSGAFIELTPATGSDEEANVTTVNPINGEGARYQVPVKWTRQDGRIWLGPVGGALDYGLAPGDSGVFRVTARVRGETPDSTLTSSSVYGQVDGRPGDYLEDAGALADNTDHCGPTVYRADVFVVKSMYNKDGFAKGYLDGGDTAHVKVEYGNAGRFEASNVMMADPIQDGFAFVANSIVNQPPGTTVQYAGPSGTWDYLPMSPTDPDVTGVRLVWDANVTMPAPATSVFVQTTVSDFDREGGRYSGTFASEEYQAVGLGGGEDDGCRTENFCNGGPYGTVYCDLGNYLPPGKCCQQCCPTWDAAENCRKITGYYDAYKEYLACLEGPGPCTAPEDTCMPKECPPPRMPGQSPFCGQGWAEPSACQAGNGYYQPDRACNRACCPGDDPRAFFAWQELCKEQWGKWMDQYQSCATQPGANCGPAPKYECDSVPAECRGGGSTGSGTYYSPEFPTDEEGNVTKWGLLIVNATFGESEAESMSIDVFTGADDSDANATFDINRYEPGPYVFDLAEAGFTASDYPNLRVRADMTGDAGGMCMKDIDPEDTDFWGMPMGLNGSDVVIGFQNNNITSAEALPTDLTAFTWTEGDANITDLHNVLPLYYEVNATVPLTDPYHQWQQSVPSDVGDDSNSTVVGWADPMPGVPMPAQCMVSSGLASTVYVPPSAATQELSTGGTDVMVADPTGAPQVFQWVIDPAEVGTSLVDISQIALRELDGEENGTNSLQNVALYVGYATSNNLSPSTTENWYYGQPAPSYQAATYTWTQDSTPFVFEMPFPLQKPFRYDPSLGLPLLIELVHYGQTFGEPFALQNRSTLQINETKFVTYIGDQEPSTRAEILVTRLTTKAVGQSEPLIVWKYFDVPGVLPHWESACLPFPRDAHSELAVTGPQFPSSALVYLNDLGVIAGTVGSRHVYGGGSGGQREGDPRFGTATLFCQHPGGGPLEYEAFALRNWETGELLPVATVTGINVDNQVIGLAAYTASAPPPSLARMEATVSPGVPAAAYHAYLWTPGPQGVATISPDGAGVPFECPSYFVPTDLSQILLDRLAQQYGQISYDIQAVPLEIDDDGNIVGTYRILVGGGGVGFSVPQPVYAQRVVLWQLNAATGSFDAILVNPPDTTAASAVQLSKMLFHNQPVGLMSATSHVIDTGAFSLTTFVDPTDPALAGHAWSYDSATGDFQDRASGFLPYDAMTGAHGSTALGTAFYVHPATKAVSTFAWAAFGDGDPVKLGWIVGRGNHIPAFANDSDLVVGLGLRTPCADVKYCDPTQQKARVFYWRACGAKDTPLLDDWTVTYQTNQNPTWGFDVALEDVCTTSMSNTVDISTTTPEITLANNTSPTSIPVNTADLTTSIDMDSTVVAYGDLIYGEARVDNAGPGDARDVTVELRVPEACANEGAVYHVDNFDGLTITNTVPSPDENVYALTFAEMPAGSGVSLFIHCYNFIEDAGRELTAGIAVSSPTIDCNANNDAATQGILVGYFPDLWSVITGPPSTTVGFATPYVLSFGNSGNSDTNGTIEVTLPPGATFFHDAAACPPVEALVELQSEGSFYNDCICTGRVTPSFDIPGVVTFTPAPYDFEGGPVTFPAGPQFDCVIPFTLTWGTCDSAGVEVDLTSKASPSGTDANIANNDSLTTTAVNASDGDLRLWIDRSEGGVEVGKEILYTVHFANLGSQAAIGTELEVQLPTGLQIQAVTPPTAFGGLGFTMGVGRGTVKAIGPGDTGAIVVRALVVGPIGAPGLATLTADSGACPVTAPVVGPALQGPNAGLHVLVSPSVGSACADDSSPVTWTVTVTNPSDSDAPSTPITVEIPDGLEYVPGSIVPASGVDTRAPTLIWNATIPKRGVLSFAFQTAVTADTGLVVMPATAGAYAGAGSLPVTCEDRVVVSKTWGLSCGQAGAAVAVDVTVKNLTQGVVSGSLYDTFQLGTSPSLALGANRVASVPVMLVPGAATTVHFTIAVPNNSPLLYGDPIFDRAVFASATSVEAASNQVGGAIADCGQATHCTSFTCDAFDGCLALPNPNPGPELCGNATDDDCDGVVDDGFEHVGEPCDALNEGGGTVPDTDLCLNDKLACSPDHLTTVCQATVFAVEICDGLDNNCDTVADEPFLAAPFNLGKPCDGTADADTCADGVFVCDGPSATKCNDDAAAAVEKCNGRDDDCDGKTDEDWPELGQACDGSNDADYCKRGKIECNINFTGTVCLEKDLGVTELCNGVDDTCYCDGPNAPVPCTPPAFEIDEGYNVGAECMTADLGVCHVPGLLACNAADATHTSTLCVAISKVNPSAEICDGLDNDCDGVVDDGPLDGSVCRDLETDILTGPPAITSSTTATFTYVNPLAVPVSSHTTFECRLDDEDWVECNHVGPNPSLTFTDLTPGSHTLLVRATRGDGSFDPTPDFWTWIIDKTIPDTVILTAPPNPSTDPSGTFVFGSPTPNPDHYMCVLDPAAGTLDATTGCPVNGHPSYQPCPVTYPYTDLDDGSHTICVYVVDTKGDVDPVPASYTWVIVTGAPETEITAGPAPITQQGSEATFDYDDPNNHDAITFECSLDGEDWVRCDGTVVGDGGTITYPAEDVPVGRHNFAVRTCDFTLPASIQCDPTPATWSWEVTAPCPNERNLTLTCSESATVDAAPDQCGWTGTSTALAKDNCSDEVTVEVEGTYPIGTSPVLFTASNDAGQSAECTTMLTVRDVTKPVVSCGTPVGTVPLVIQATASDACTAAITIDNVRCSRVVDGAATPIELADCPLTVEGDTIQITSRLGEGTLEITYDVTAEDPSHNSEKVSCDESFEPDRDGDGIVDAQDNCVATQNGDQKDRDEDGIGDLCDVCPDASDPGQADRDGDGIGDACADKDKDGVLDLTDNCVDDPNTDQKNTDLDELGDACDPSPFDGLKAEGDGSCSGGGLGALGGLLGLAGLALVRRRR